MKHPTPKFFQIVITVFIVVAATFAIVRDVHRGETSIVGEWRSKLSALQLEMIPTFPGMPKLTYTAHSWQFDSSGKAVETLFAVDSKGHDVTDTTVGTYLTYGNTMVVTYAMSVHSDSSGRTATPLTGSMITDYRIAGNHLIFMPTESPGNPSVDLTSSFERVR